MNKLRTTALDLGSLVTSNKNMPEYDMFDDEASQVIVATKNSAEGNPNAPNKIPHVLSDSDDNQFVHIPTGPTTTMSLANNRQIDFDMFEDDLIEAKLHAPQIPNYSTKPKKSHKYKNKNKKKLTRKQKVGKQATSSNETKGSSTSGHEGDPPEKTILNNNSSSGSNNNSNAYQRGDMNDNSNQ